jgi:hypothetical protein
MFMCLLWDPAVIPAVLLCACEYTVFDFALELDASRVYITAPAWPSNMSFEQSCSREAVDTWRPLISCSLDACHRGRY